MSRWRFLVLLALAMALPIGAESQAQQPGWLQVWKVRAPDTGTYRIGYWDGGDQALASYDVTGDFYTNIQAGGRVFGQAYRAILIFDPYLGNVRYEKLTGLQDDTDAMHYAVSPPAPMADGAQYAYSISRVVHDGSEMPLSTIYAKAPGIAPATKIYEERLPDIYLNLEPIAFVGSGQLLLHEMPHGIGGYILFWQYQGVRLFDPDSGVMTPVGAVDGYASDGQTFAEVVITDGEPALHVFSLDGARQVYPYIGLGEVVRTGGDAVFSPAKTKVAYQVARNEPENEKFWTIVVDLQTGQSALVLEDQAVEFEPRYGRIGGWLDDNTLAVGDGWSPMSAIINVTTGQVIAERTGGFMGYAEGISATTGFAPSGPAPAQCPDAPVSRLQPDGSGRVTITNGLPVNVRQQPGGEQIGTQPEGAEFIVYDGPNCRDGYAWWFVGFADGLQGFVAEGDAGGYYLEPWP
jgi:hypothetical protein